MFNRLNKETKKMKSSKVVTRNAFGADFKRDGAPDIQVSSYEITIGGVAMPLVKFQ